MKKMIIICCFIGPFIFKVLNELLRQNPCKLNRTGWANKTCKLNRIRRKVYNTHKQTFQCTSRARSRMIMLMIKIVRQLYYIVIHTKHNVRCLVRVPLWKTTMWMHSEYFVWDEFVVRRAKRICLWLFGPSHRTSSDGRIRLAWPEQPQAQARADKPHEIRHTWRQHLRPMTEIFRHITVAFKTRRTLNEMLMVWKSSYTRVYVLRLI